MKCITLIKKEKVFLFSNTLLWQDPVCTHPIWTNSVYNENVRLYTRNNVVYLQEQKNGVIVHNVKNVHFVHQRRCKRRCTRRCTRYFKFRIFWKCSCRTSVALIILLQKIIQILVSSDASGQIQKHKTY